MTQIRSFLEKKLEFSPMKKFLLVLVVVILSAVFLNSCEQCYECTFTYYKRDNASSLWKKSSEDAMTHCGVNSEFIKKYEKDNTYESSDLSKQSCSCRIKN